MSFLLDIAIVYVGLLVGSGICLKWHLLHVGPQEPFGVEEAGRMPLHV